MLTQQGTDAVGSRKTSQPGSTFAKTKCDVTQRFAALTNTCKHTFSVHYFSCQCDIYCSNEDGGENDVIHFQRAQCIGLKTWLNIQYVYHILMEP